MAACSRILVRPRTSGDRRDGPEEEGDDDAVEYDAIPLEEDIDKVVKTRGSKVTDIRVTHKDTARYGCTPGCEGCSYIQRSAKMPPGVGHSKECRQRIREFASLDTKIHMCNENGHMKTSTLEELLPDSFGPENL